MWLIVFMIIIIAAVIVCFSLAAAAHLSICNFDGSLYKKRYIREST